MDFAPVYFMLVIFFHPTMSQFDTGMSEDRRVIVHLFEWPFDAIKEECKNVLGPQKFGGVLVAPIAENLLVQSSGGVRRPWWEIYQPLSWNIQTRKGNEQQFKEMVEVCNKNNVRVYVDAVFNHAVGRVWGGDSGDVVGVGGTHANTKTEDYPGLGYTEANFHKPCQMNFNDKTSVRNCELGDLEDVNQTIPYVQDKIATFLNRQLDFGVAGFRIDAAKHMWPEDLRKIYGMLKNVSVNGVPSKGCIWMLEVIDDNGEYQGDYKNVGAEYDFECLKPITQVFKKGESSMSNINNCAKYPRYLSQKVVALTANQDTQRGTWPNGFSNSDSNGIQRGIDAFILAYTKEIPNIYSGYSYKNTNSGPPMDDSEKITSPLNCTNGWTCEHRFPPHQWIVKFFTNYVQDAPVENWQSNWDDGTELQAAFTRGKKGFAVFNADTKTLKHTFKVPLSPGVYCDLATGYYSPEHQNCRGTSGITSRKVEIKSDGTVEVSLPGMARSSSVNLRDTVAEPAYLVISDRSKIL
ncbi:alpha-amylase A isoform X1 [Bemisia tabaci]|uniref:alpha-amylase A isoform X1 n=1 Tax=Bemisia tabaci TaxID=7038 RepID=UPI003B27D5D7